MKDEWLKDALFLSFRKEFRRLTCNSPQLAAGSPYMLSLERERASRSK